MGEGTADDDLALFRCTFPALPRSTMSMEVGGLHRWATPETTKQLRTPFWMLRDLLGLNVLSKRVDDLWARAKELKSVLPRSRREQHRGKEYEGTTRKYFDVYRYKAASRTRFKPISTLSGASGGSGRTRSINLTSV